MVDGKSESELSWAPDSRLKAPLSKSCTRPAQWAEQYPAPAQGTWCLRNGNYSAIFILSRCTTNASGLDPENVAGSSRSCTSAHLVEWYGLAHAPASFCEPHDLHTHQNSGGLTVVVSNDALWMLKQILSSHPFCMAPSESILSLRALLSKNLD